MELFKRRPAHNAPPPFVFGDDALQKLAETQCSSYASASPFPHIVIDDFLPPEIAQAVLEAFPAPDAPCWLERDKLNQPKKLGVGHARRLEGLDPWLLSLLNAFNSYPLLHFLETLTGIEKLLPDPQMHGGALHQILPGGSLKVHADFNFLDELNLHRRLNLLLYMNPDWQDEWGGHLELWPQDMRACAQKIAPIFNRCVIFSTTSNSYHGHPEPLTCPDHITRKSLAFYYYTAQAGDEVQDPHSTLWQERPTREES